MSREEIQQALMTYQQQLQEEQGKQMEELAQKNLDAGEAFLAENAEREGVETTESGLQYEVLEQGDGEKPAATDTVQVHYTGELLSGEVFDSSRERGEPVTFALNQVIPGWTEALTMMKPGAKWEIAVPQELAYGSRGKGLKIPPYSTLRFEIELISSESVGQTSTPTRKPVTSNVVRIPSSSELKQGAKPEVLSKDQVEKLKKEK
mgnify:CR=1 FL=1